jgi:hypothetical protein
LVLEPWLELAILTLITGGAYYEAHLVTRGSGAKQPPAHRHFALKGETPEERMATARVVISCVEGMHSAASNEAPPYFERASFELGAKKYNKAGAALDRDLTYSAAAAYVFGEIATEAIFSKEANNEDFMYLGLKKPGAPVGRAQLYADFVWGAFVDTTVVKTSSGEQSSDEEGVEDDN